MSKLRYAFLYAAVLGVAAGALGVAVQSHKMPKRRAAMRLAPSVTSTASHILAAPPLLVYGGPHCAAINVRSLYNGNDGGPLGFNKDGGRADCGKDDAGKFIDAGGWLDGGMIDSGLVQVCLTPQSYTSTTEGCLNFPLITSSGIVATSTYACDLPASSTVAYRIISNGTDDVSTHHHFVTPPLNGTHRAFNIGFSSCEDPKDIVSKDSMPAFAAIKAKLPVVQPDGTTDRGIYVSLGDTVYANSNNKNFLNTLYTNLRNIPEYGDLFAEWFISVTIDDHEFCVADNGDSTCTIKDMTEGALREFYPIIPDAAAGCGLAHKITYNDVDLINLDTRYCRDPLTVVDGTMLGAAQWTWLEDAVRTSTATWVFIDSSVSMYAGNDSWMRKYPKEAERLMKLTQLRPRVIMLAGDIHTCEDELLILGSDLTAYPFYCLDASGVGKGVTSGTEPDPITSAHFSPEGMKYPYGYFKIIEVHDEDPTHPYLWIRGYAMTRGGDIGYLSDGGAVDGGKNDGAFVDGGLRDGGIIDGGALDSNIDRSGGGTKQWLDASASDTGQRHEGLKPAAVVGLYIDGLLLVAYDSGVSGDAAAGDAD